MKWLKRFLAAGMLMVLLAAIAVYFTPLDSVVPEIEWVLSAGLNEPVEIQHLEIGAIPAPHLVLKNVKIGKQSGISLHSVKVMFGVRSLFDSRWLISRVILAKGSATQEQVEKLFALLQGYTATPVPIHVDELQFADIYCVTPQITFGPLNGRLKFAPDNSLTYAAISLFDKKIMATLYRQPGNTYALEARIKEWQLPGSSGLYLTSLNAEGMLAWPRFHIRKLSAEAYGTHIEGGALMEWSPKWKMALWMDSIAGKVEHLPQLDNRIVIAGDFSGKGVASAYGETVQALPGNLKFDAVVEVKKASVHVPGSLYQALVVDEIKARMSGSLAEHTLTGLQGKLYGGEIEGFATMRGMNPMLQADIVLRNIATGPLVEAFSNEIILTGTLAGKAKLSVKNSEASHLLQKFQLDGEFRVKNGMLRKMDMMQAASNPFKERKGGVTDFDELSSLLSIDANGYHLRKLKISSGVLNAEGMLDISPERQLSGLLDTEVKGTASLISMPLIVSGQLNNPALRPARSALAGASVGTALMGPGLGTALGIRAGSLLNKWFGKKDEKTKVVKTGK